MHVSVIVTCYNEERNIRDCLKTLVNQTYSSDQYEVIVVDGCSQDGTQSIVKEFEKVYHNVVLVVEPKKGTAAGRNRGVVSGTV